MKEPNDAQLKIRISAELKSAIQHAAIDNGRSLNAEIWARLQRSVDAAPGGTEAYDRFVAMIMDFSSLSQQDRERIVEIVTEAGTILGRRQTT